MRRLNAWGYSGRHLQLDGFCQRQAASPPSFVSESVSGGLPLRPRASRPSPSHRYAAGPSLYKRGCLRLRNSPAASRHYALRPLSLLMPGSGHTRPPLHPARRCPPGPFSQFSVLREAFSRRPGQFSQISVPQEAFFRRQGPFSQISVPRVAFSRRPGPFLPFSVPIGQRAREISLAASLTGVWTCRSAKLTSW